MVNVACVQPELGSLRGRERVDAIVQRLRTIDDADLIVLPELWHVGYFSFDRYDDEAQGLDGPVIETLRGEAARTNAYVHAGSIVERAEGGRLCNTSVLLSPAGDVVATYRKMHLFGYRSKETELLAPGNEVTSVDTELGRIGLVTCYDLRFPELFRLLADDGVTMVLVTSAWPVDRIEHWRVLTRARALDGLFHLVACNAAGTDESVTLGGRSVVVDPLGTVVAEAAEGDEILRASIDTEQVAKVRGEFPFLADRRIEIKRP